MSLPRASSRRGAERELSELSKRKHSIRFNTFFSWLAGLCLLRALAALHPVQTFHGTRSAVRSDFNRINLRLTFTPHSYYIYIDVHIYLVGYESMQYPLCFLPFPLFLAFLWYL